MWSACSFKHFSEINPEVIWSSATLVNFFLFDPKLLLSFVRISFCVIEYYAEYHLPLFSLLRTKRRLQLSRIPLISLVTLSVILMRMHWGVCRLQSSPITCITSRNAVWTSINWKSLERSWFKTLGNSHFFIVFCEFLMFLQEYFSAHLAKLISYVLFMRPFF